MLTLLLLVLYLLKLYSQVAVSWYSCSSSQKPSLRQQMSRDIISHDLYKDGRNAGKALAYLWTHFD